MGLLSKPRKPFVRNHYLPKWIHRLCNAVLAAFVACLILIYVLPWRLALYTDAGLFVLILCLDPSRISLVDGLAGEDGYVDLDESP
jgi:hypothetical protein